MQRLVGWLLVLVPVALVLDVGGASVAGERLGKERASEPATAETRAAAAYRRLPLSFEPNRGQADPRVRFLGRGSGYGIGLTRTGAVLALNKPLPRLQSLRDGWVRPRANGASIALRFLGASPRLELVGRAVLPGKVNYLGGRDPSTWLRGLPTYGEVRYRNLYPGIDARFYGRDGQLEYDLILSPGAEPARIKLALRGAGQLRLNARGALVVRLGGGTLVQQPPRIYQTIAGRRQPVSGRYVLRGRDGLGFQLGPYDDRRALVIDPVLSYSTYLGGTNFDAGGGIAVDSSGSAYVTGGTLSFDFPTTPGTIGTSFAGTVDAFVSKLAPDGSSLVYSTYVGGSGGDNGSAIAVDASGSAYVTGLTQSLDFPTTSGSFDTSYNGGGQDAFVMRLAPNGSSLVYSSYLGGGDIENGRGIAADPSGNAYVTGWTMSPEFPTTPDAFDTVFSGGVDAFVMRLAPNGSVVYSSFLGGSGGENGNAIAIDASGSAYVSGHTSGDFPTTPDAFDTSFGGEQDAFVTKVPPDGSSLVYSTYLGGSDSDFGLGIAADASGAYVTGFTGGQVPEGPAGFPTTPDAFDTVLGGEPDAFVTKVAPSGSSLVYSSFLGGSGGENGNAIAIDASGSAYVTGFTSGDFPITPDAVDTSLGGEQDAFVTKVAPDGARLVYSTYLGGSGVDHGRGIAVDASSNAYLTGSTASLDYPTVSGAFDASFNGSEDAFVTKLAETSTTVHVDIKPGDARNPINLRARGLIPVAILSTASFDATTVDPASVCFGDAESANERDCTEAHGRGHVEDVNGDGQADLLLHFEVVETGIDAGDTRACLTGKTSGAVSVEGCDSIRTT